MALAFRNRHRHFVMLAVIIPTLNAQSCLRFLLPELNGMRVIISDGGSFDDTLKLALSSGGQIASGQAGRGAQLARGAELAAAQNDITALLFLHADARLLPGWKAALQTALRAENRAWYFRYRPRGRGLSVMWLRFIVWLRGWAWRLPYGDQGLLIPLDMYTAVGGYDREKSLFEDVDMVDRIKAKYGRTALRPLPIGISADISDHLEQGIWTRGWRNFKLLRAYRRGEPIDVLMQRYGR